MLCLVCDQNWSQRKTRSMLLGAMLCAFLMILSGCSAPTKIMNDEPLPTPASWREPQSPEAKNFSERVRLYLQKVENYFSEMPEFTTQQ